jgi:DNA-binding CsgD family transcriptional regulator
MACRNGGDVGGEGLAALGQLQRLVDHMVAPVFVFDLTTRRGCFGNAAAAALMGTSWPVLQDLLRGDLAELVGPEAAERVEQGLAVLATGAVKSYQGERTYPDRNGVQVHAQHTVTRLDLCDAPPVAVGVVARLPVAGRAEPDADRGAVGPVLATLDHEWRVDTVGPDVEPGLFGMRSRRFLGDRLHEHVHPEDGPALTAAFERAPDEEAATTTVRLRARSGWRPVDVLAGALCSHQPPRVGVLLAARRASEPVEHWAVAGGRLNLAGGELSPQQREVVTRLLRGENVASMAAAMHLSRSTIRNHLCAVYVKAGVHSQAELIAHVTGRAAEAPGG